MGTLRLREIKAFDLGGHRAPEWNSGKLVSALSITALYSLSLKRTDTNVGTESRGGDHIVDKKASKAQNDKGNTAGLTFGGCVSREYG